ncbi:MAG: hypothetical protein AAF578_02805 [Pseudomonadota bacterium]
MSGCAAPVLIAEPEPEARIGVISLVNEYPSHFVSFSNTFSTELRKVASTSDYGEQYLGAVTSPLGRSDFSVQILAPSSSLVTRRDHLFAGEIESARTADAVTTLGKANDLDYVFVVFPFSNSRRWHSKFRIPDLFLEGYGLYSECNNYRCRNWAINSVSVTVFDVNRVTSLEAQNYDFYFWDYMPEELVWTSRDSVEELTSHAVDQATEVALGDFKLLYADLLTRARFTD